MAVGSEDEPVQPVVAVREHERAADVDFPGKPLVLLRLVARKRLRREVSVVRLYERPHAKARGREPFALRADVPERHAEVRGMSAPARPVGGHGRQQLHGHVLRILRMGSVELEVRVRGVVRFVHMPVHALRPHGERVVFPVPVHVEILDNRAQAVLHFDVRLALELRRLMVERRMVAPEDERCAFPVEREVREAVDHDVRPIRPGGRPTTAVKAPVGSRRQLDPRRAAALCLCERRMNGDGVVFVRLGKPEVFRADDRTALAGRAPCARQFNLEIGAPRRLSADD